VSFIKSSASFAISTAVKIAAGLLVMKTMAWQLGPERFGVLGQLMTVVAISSMFAGGGISVGLTRRLSERLENRSVLHQRLGAATVIYLSTSLLVTAILLAGDTEISQYVFSDTAFKKVFWMLALCYWSAGFYNLSQAAFSSRQDVPGIVMINVLGTILGTGLFLALLMKFGFTGAAYGIVLLPAANGIAALWFSSRRLPADWRRLHWNTDKAELKELASYSIVMLISAATIPCAQFLVRNLLGAHVGWQEVGYWQGMLKISDVYMQFVGVVLASFVLPQFSSANSITEIHNVLRRALTTLAPLAIVGLLLAYFLRHTIIQILFSPSFSPMADLFLPQAIGDLMRIFSSTLTYVFLARGYRRIAIASELIQGAGLYVFSKLLISTLLGNTPVYAYGIASAINLTSMLFAYQWLHREMKQVRQAS